MRRILLAVLVAATSVAGVALSQSASAAVSCTGEIDGPGTLNGPVIVPSGSTCKLQGIVVNGSVTVNAGGRLITGSAPNMHIKGAVYSDRAGTSTSTDPLGDPSGNGHYDFSIIICNTFIDGSLTVTHATSTVQVGDDEWCGPNRVDGVVNLSSNPKGVTLVGNSNNPGASCVLVSCGLNGASVNVNNNSGTPNDPESGPPGPSAEITFNRVAGSLNCSGNATIENNTNNVVGASTGQCAIDHSWP